MASARSARRSRIRRPAEEPAEDAPQAGRCALLFQMRDGGQARPGADGLAVGGLDADGLLAVGGLDVDGLLAVGGLDAHDFLRSGLMWFRW